MDVTESILGSVSRGKNELHLENANAKGLATELERLANTKIGPNRLPLEWDPKWSNHRGRLRVRFDAGDDPSNIAQTMLDFIGFSRSRVVDLASRQIESGTAQPISIEPTGQVADDAVQQPKNRR